MNFPLISEYVEAVKMAEDNFDRLCHLRPVLDKDGQPVMSSGNFAVVFKMRNTESGKFHAVRCFHREQEGRAESYRQIEEALRQVQSPYLVSFRYMDKELFVDSKQTGGETEFPVLLMDWVEGVTLDRYIREHINDKDALEVLAYRFSLMASWLIAQPFAHGDLKPDNILVRPDGTITLVDYDGMFVPSMQGQSARELGSPDFRHPLRQEADFDGSIDDFPLISILLSLKAIAVNPSLLDQFGASDRLLFSEADYRDISKCRVLHEIFPSSDNELNKVISLFTLALTERKFVGVSPSLLELAEPACLADEEFSTEVTDEDWAEAVVDEFGVKYSKDGKRLLKGSKNLYQYAVREGTRIICDGAFYFYDGNNSLTSIHIPNSVTIIGEAAFGKCVYLNDIHIPDSVTRIEPGAFMDCYGLTNIKIPNSITKIEDWCFYDTHLTNIHIPNNIKEIGNKAFCDCCYLTDIYIPKSLTKIGEEAFVGCTNVKKIIYQSYNPYNEEECDAIIGIENENVILIAGWGNINIPTCVTKIGKSAFKWCKRLTSINIPDSVTGIGESAFSGCESLTSINIPDGVTEIGGSAFQGCKSLASINIPDGVTEIGGSAFRWCESLTSINIPDSVTEIGKEAFWGCESLASINIPDSVTEIGGWAFERCRSLTSINIPNSVTEIGRSAFSECESLTSINIPDSVTEIGGNAFLGCNSLTSINIPDSVTKIGEGAFLWCWSLTNIYIPQNTKEKFAKLLPNHKHLLVEK